MPNDDAPRVMLDACASHPPIHRPRHSPASCSPVAYLSQGDVMTISRMVVGGVAVLGLCAATGSAYAGHHLMSVDPLQHFQKGVQAYVTLHRQVERLLPPLEISSDTRKIQQWSDWLALEIVAGRQTAREGDIIDPAAAA